MNEKYNLAMDLSEHDYNLQSKTTAKRKTNANRYSIKTNKRSEVTQYRAALNTVKHVCITFARDPPSKYCSCRIQKYLTLTFQLFVYCLAAISTFLILLKFMQPLGLHSSW